MGIPNKRPGTSSHAKAKNMHLPSYRNLLCFVLIVALHGRRAEGLQTSTKPINGEHFLLPKTTRQKIQGLTSRVTRPLLQKLWPGTLSDPNYPNSLPRGPFGCPFVGFNPKLSSPSFGPGLLFYKLSQRLGHPRIFKFFSKNKGIVIVSGYENTKLLLNKEFDTVVSQVVPFTSKLVGENSLRCSRDKQEHIMLRKLIGMALAPSKVNNIIPALQETSQQLIEEALASAFSRGTAINVEELCQCYTLHVACRLLIGLDDLPNNELSHFRNQVRTWIEGLYATNEDWKDARAYLVRKIESKLDSLDKNGPDASSTVSGMWFATDPDDSTQRRLTRDEVIDNTLLLILAGSETSASTLTNCMFLFGLHINAWTTVVEEQVLCIQNHGNDLTRKVLDNDCMYLDAVVRESLRLRPIVGGSMRGTTSTIVVDGCRIPADWGVAYDRYLTHLLDPMTQVENGDNMDVRNGFRPERWLNEATCPGQDFIPFGLGPRYCIGADLAMVEMKVFLTAFARSLSDFDLATPNPKGAIRWRQKSIIPIPEEGVFIRPRQHETRKAI